MDKDDLCCWECGSTAPLVPRWYRQVMEAFDKISIMPLVLEPEQIEGMYAQAYAGAESSAMEPAGDSPEYIEPEAAERVAMAIAVIAYGVEFAQAGPPETLAAIEADRMKPEPKPLTAFQTRPLTPAEYDDYIRSGLDLGMWRRLNRPRYRRAVDLVREAYLHDPTVSHDDYGRLMDEADLVDQHCEWEAEAASSKEE